MVIELYCLHKLTRRKYIMKSDIIPFVKTNVQKSQSIFNEVVTTPECTAIYIDDVVLRIYVAEERGFVTLASAFSPPEAVPYLGYEINDVDYITKTIHLGNRFGTAAMNDSHRKLIAATLRLLTRMKVKTQVQ